MNVEFLKNMWVEDWIWLLEVRKWLDDFEEYELWELRKYILWLSNQELLVFMDKYAKIDTPYLTKCFNWKVNPYLSLEKFLWALFLDHIDSLFTLIWRLKIISNFYLSADRVAFALQKTS